MAVATLGSFTQSELEYIRESTRLKSELDWQDHIVTAERKGLKRGLREGRKVGLAKGRNEAGLEYARKMKADNMSISQISKYTDLPAEVIAQL